MKGKKLWKLVILGVILALVTTQCAAPAAPDSGAPEAAKAEVAAAQATAEAALAEVEAAKAGSAEELAAAQAIAEAARAAVEAAAAEQEMAEAAEDKPKPYDGTVLRMLAPYEPVSWVIPDMVNEFYKETGIRVAVDLLPGGVMLQKMVSEFQAETGFYDVFRESPSWIPDHTAAGWLEPVNDLIERDRAEIDVDDFIPSVWDTHTKVGLFPDQIWGLPLNLTTRILVYDKELFNDPQEQADFKDKYGYDLAPPKTTQEWLDMAEFFTRDTDGDGEIDLWGHISPQKQGFPAATWGGQMLAWTFGCEIYDENFNATLDDPRCLDSWRFGLELNQYMPTAVHAMEFYDHFTWALDGKMAMAEFLDSWVQKLWDPNETDTPGRFGAALMPYHPENGRGWVAGKSNLAGGLIAMNAHSKNKEATWEFMKWITSKETAHRFATEHGILFARTSILEDPNIEQLHPAMPELLPVMTKAWEVTGKAAPNVPGAGAILGVLGDTWSQVAAGGADPEQALLDANDEINRILEEQGVKE
jgi:multiple sugar transport system substrate-binding protein